MDKRELVTTSVREDAFKNLEASNLPERGYLRLLKPEYAKP